MRKVVIVTGASRGIGKGIAVALGAAGARVYLTGRSVIEGDGEMPGTIHETARLAAEAGGEAIAVRCDHNDDDAVAALFERVWDDDGRLDLLVNNVANLPPQAARKTGMNKHFWELGTDIWDDYHRVGLRSHYVASRLAAQAMIAQRSGLIVNVSSAAAVQYFHSVANGTAKAALDKLTADMAVELDPFGVSVVSVWPGLVKTEMVLWMAGAGMVDISAAETPAFTGRAVVALLGDKNVAARTGRAFHVADLAREYGFVDVDGTQPERMNLRGVR